MRASAPVSRRITWIEPGRWAPPLTSGPSSTKQAPQEARAELAVRQRWRWAVPAARFPQRRERGAQVARPLSRLGWAGPLRPLEAARPAAKARQREVPVDQVCRRAGGLADPADWQALAQLALTGTATTPPRREEMARTGAVVLSADRRAFPAYGSVFSVSPCWDFDEVVVRRASQDRTVSEP